MGDDDSKTDLYAGWVDVMPAKKLANAIGSLKLVLIALVAVGTVFMLGTLPSEVGFLAIIYGLVVAATIYVGLGWLEQTLRLLVGIAHNTAASAGLDNAPFDDSTDLTS